MIFPRPHLCLTHRRYSYPVWGERRELQRCVEGLCRGLRRRGDGRRRTGEVVCAKCICLMFDENASLENIHNRNFLPVSTVPTLPCLSCTAFCFPVFGAACFLLSSLQGQRTDTRVGRCSLILTSRTCFSGLHS